MDNFICYFYLYYKFLFGMIMMNIKEFKNVKGYKRIELWKYHQQKISLKITAWL